MERDDLLAIGAFAGVVVLAIVAITFAAAYVDATSCRAQWLDSGYESQWGWSSGCRVNVGGRWVPDGTVREIPQR